MEDMRDVQSKLKWTAHNRVNQSARVEVSHREITVFWVSFTVRDNTGENAGAMLTVDFSEGQEYELLFNSVAEAKDGANAELKEITLKILSRVLPGR